MDFWAVHDTGAGVALLLGLLFFPRITMLVAVATPFGWLAWLGWFFVPRFLAAVLGTSMYWDTNPTLCVLGWMAAFSVSGAEVEKTTKQRERRRR